MSKLVKHRRRVVPRDQHRFAGLALNKVGVIRNDCRHLAVHAKLTAIGVHPRTRTLAVSGIRIEIPKADMLAGYFIFDLVNRDVRVIDRHARDRRKAEIEQLASDPKHCLSDLVELQIRLYLILIEIVSGLTNLFHVIAIIPRLDLDLGSFFVGESLHIGDFLMDSGNSGRPHALHQFHCVFGCFRHLRLKTPVSVCCKAEQFRTFCSKLKNLCNPGVVVAGVTVIAAIDKHFPDLFPKCTIRGISQKRIYRRPRVADNPGIWDLFRGCGICGRILKRLRQTGKIGLVRDGHIKLAFVAE